MSALTTHTYSNPREKKRKRNELKETPTSDRKTKKGREKDHLKKTSLGPLRQGQRLDTSVTKLCSSKERKPPTKVWKPQRAPPAQMQAPPEPMQLPLDECMQTTWWKQSSCISSVVTGQTGRHHWSDRCSTCAQDQHSDWWDWWPRPVRPMHNRAQKWLETTWKPSKCIQLPNTSSNFSPLLAMHESSQKCKTFNLELLK
jgi:hypothetical protein